jgi:hypothetical protein
MSSQHSRAKSARQRKQRIHRRAAMRKFRKAALAKAAEPKKA